MRTDKLITSIIACIAAIAAPAQTVEPNSVKTQELNEVVVEAQHQSTSTTIFTFISTSNQNSPSQASASVSTAEMDETAMSHNVFVEYFGPSFGIGVGFDSRFRNGSPFGYRVGLSYTNGSYEDNLDWRFLDFEGVLFPLEINAIFGKRKSKFEIGVGATPSILHRVYTTEFWCGDGSLAYNTTRGNKLNILGTINIGYRYQRERGFFLRAGLTILAGDLKCSPIDGVWILPNISLGYTLKY